MIELSLPAGSKTVERPVGTKYLVPRAPGSSWDGWFAIAIFPPGSRVKWLKAHLYRSVCRPGRYPLAALEGFTDRSESMIAWATGEGASVLKDEPGAGVPGVSANPLKVSLGDLFLLEGTAPDYTMVFRLPGAKAMFHFRAGWPIWWARGGRMVTYPGQHSSVAVRLERDTETFEAEGFGVMEHVCGISVPFDFTRHLFSHFHWDVLAFHAPVSPFDSAAGLHVGLRGGVSLAIKAAAKVPGLGPAVMRGLSIRYLETSLANGESGEDIMVPLAWEGRMRNRAGELRYEARSNTPVTAILPGGGFLGFDFEGEWAPRGRPIEKLEGTGFTEYADFSGGLAALARGLGSR